MRKLLILILAAAASTAPALARDAPEDREAPGGRVDGLMTGQDQDETLDQSVLSIERNIKAHLALVGFTDIEMIPTSFLVRAKDRDGYPVMLVLSPDSIADFNGSGPGQDSRQTDGSARETFPEQSPSVTFPGATDGE